MNADSVNRRKMCRVEQRSTLPASVEDVWTRVASMDGINDELMPYMRMVLPRRHRGKTVADVEVGRPLGRVLILYGGFLPLDYDDLTIVELTPQAGFREESTMASMRVWTHTRRLTPRAGTSTEVHDVLEFVPRALLRPAAPLLMWFIGFLFRHRHRRLARHFD